MCIIAGIPDVSKVPHAKLTKNEGLKKLMEAKWSKEVCSTIYGQ